MKILKVLEAIFNDLTFIFLGFTFALKLYDRHLCCDKGSDCVYFALATLICSNLSVLMVLIYKHKEDKTNEKS